MHDPVSPRPVPQPPELEDRGRRRLLTRAQAHARSSAIDKLDTLERPPADDTDSIFDLRVCFGCGCTDDHACWPPCWWIDVDQCSSCEVKPRRLDTLGHHLQRAAAENA